MDVLAVFCLFFVSLIISLYHGIPLLYPLLLGLGCFILISLRRGHKLDALGKMMLEGSKKSLVVIKIFVLIGALTAVWRACGTVAFIVYYGIALMNAQYFVLFAFLLCCVVSFLLGTSFGTVGTIGVVLMVLAKSGSVDVNVAAGAIIAGAYFGDRCSPMSSSANLVATLTNTDLYTNITNMLKTSILPLALSIIGYTLLSHWNPLTFHDSGVASEIQQLFDIRFMVLLPAIIVLVAAALRVDVKLSMAISILSGLVIGVLVQHDTVLDMLHYIVFGYSLDAPGLFAGIIRGGGLLSMVNVGLIVLISSAYSGIFAGTRLLAEVEKFFETLSQKVGVYPATILTSIVSAAFACNQTLAVILTHQLEEQIYEKREIPSYRLALDLENTVIVISALIPWNIAGAFPTAALSADAGFILYAFYLFLVPLLNIFYRKPLETLATR